MRYLIPRFLFSALALAAFAITTTGCAMDDQASTNPEGSGGDSTATVDFALAECDAPVECGNENLVGFYQVHFGVSEEVATRLVDCLTEGGEAVCDEGGLCRFPSVSFECIAPFVSSDACVSDAACDDGNACTTNVCTEYRCVSTPTPDPTPEDATECLQRTCSTSTGWGNTPLPAETACDDDDECTTASNCDGEGVCVPDTSTVVCCDGFVDCAGSCTAEGELDACRAPTGSESELTGDFGRCVCFPEAGFSNEDSTSCCLGHGGLGCTPPSEAPSSEEICNAYSWCCEEGWWSLCAAAYATANPGVCDYLTAEVCDDGIDNDRDVLVDCDDTDCAEDTACIATTDVTITVNEGFLIRGCLGETELAAPAYMVCDVTSFDNTGTSSYTLTEGQGLLFNVQVISTGDSIPRITSVGPPLVSDLRGFTLAQIFVDPTLAGLSCAVVSTSLGGQNWLCVNGALSSALP